MTPAQLDLPTIDLLQTQLEQVPSDLTAQSLFNDSPILFLESLDQVHAHASEQVEQAEHHTTFSKGQTPPDTSHETPPPPPKRKYGIRKDPYSSLRLYVHLSYNPNLRCLQFAMTTTYQYSDITNSRSKHN